MEKKEILGKLEFSGNRITGIYQNNEFSFLKLLSPKENYKENIWIDKKNLKFLNPDTFSIISNVDSKSFFTKTVSDEFYLVKNKINILEDSYIQKIISSLKMVGFDASFLEREIETLSKSEKKLLLIALNLIKNPEVIVFLEPFLGLDRKNSFSVKRIILNLKKKYHKTILIISQDPNFLYEMCDDLVVFNRDGSFIKDRVDKIYENFESFPNLETLLPDSILFWQLAKNHHIVLKPQKDIKDLIKDVYRNVQE